MDPLRGQVVVKKGLGQQKNIEKILINPGTLLRNAVIRLAQRRIGLLKKANHLLAFYKLKYKSFFFSKSRDVYTQTQRIYLENKQQYHLLENLLKYGH
jgi:aspartokinase-like uncharacterized kinase